MSVPTSRHTWILVTSYFVFILIVSLSSWDWSLSLNEHQFRKKIIYEKADLGPWTLAKIYFLILFSLEHFININCKEWDILVRNGSTSLSFNCISITQMLAIRGNPHSSIWKSASLFVPFFFFPLYFVALKTPIYLSRQSKLILTKKEQKEL